MREMAIEARVRYPHDEWSTAVNEVDTVRRKFAHLLHLDQTEGEYPNRTLHFTRLGEPGEPWPTR